MFWRQFGSSGLFPCCRIPRKRVILKLLKYFRKSPTNKSRHRSDCLLASKSVKLPDTMELVIASIKPTASRNCLLRFLCCFLHIFFISAAFADAPDWENQHVLHINTEPPRSTFIPFATVQQAMDGNVTNSPFYLSLNGPWKFNWVDNPSERPTNFFETGFDDSAWTNIDVPSNWEMKGFGT